MSMEVTITIDKDGNVTSDVVGGHGKACEIVSRTLAKVGKVQLESKKPEYYENVNANLNKVGR